MKFQEERFKEETENAWEQVLGGKAGRFNFEKMKSTLFQILRLQEAGKDVLSVYSATLLTTYIAEKNLAEDERNWTERLKNG